MSLFDHLIPKSVCMYLSLKKEKEKKKVDSTLSHNMRVREFWRESLVTRMPESIRTISFGFIWICQTYKSYHKQIMETQQD